MASAGVVVAASIILVGQAVVFFYLRAAAKDDSSLRISGGANHGQFSDINVRDQTIYQNNSYFQISPRFLSKTASRNIEQVCKGKNINLTPLPPMQRFVTLKLIPPLRYVVSLQETPLHEIDFISPYSCVII